jgi:hypothetical protein
VPSIHPLCIANLPLSVFLHLDCLTKQSSMQSKRRCTVHSNGHVYIIIAMPTRAATPARAPAAMVAAPLSAGEEDSILSSAADEAACCSGILLSRHAAYVQTRATKCAHVVACTQCCTGALKKTFWSRTRRSTCQTVSDVWATYAGRTSVVMFLHALCMVSAGSRWVTSRQTLKRAMATPGWTPTHVQSSSTSPPACQELQEIQAC